jgi:hypothetical protein
MKELFNLKPKLVVRLDHFLNKSKYSTYLYSDASQDPKELIQAFAFLAYNKDESGWNLHVQESKIIPPNFKLPDPRY